MRIFVTGEKGFIAQNLPKSLIKMDIETASVNGLRLRGAEPCVHANSVDQWVVSLRKSGADLIIHNAAVVGTDVVALNPCESTLSNVAGTHTICRAARALGIPVCYIGTTVIYDTPNYQNAWITERAEVMPHTLYGIQKLAAEHIVRATCDKWLIIRPLFAFGGAGDMNSLIAKTFFSYLKNPAQRIDMFLDPDKIKDYMHVEDFCDAVAMACARDSWNDDFNVAAETPLVTGDVVRMMSDVSGGEMEKCVRWWPKTDYLGNHRLSSEKFRKTFGWYPKISLQDGIEDAWKTMNLASLVSPEYNPLKYLEKAEREGFDLTEYYY